MATGSLGRAFVQVYADLSKFTPGLKQKIKAALDEQTKGIRFDELDKASEKAGQSAADHLAKGVDSKIEKNMERSGKKGGTSLAKGMSSAVGAMSALLLPALITFGVSAAGALAPAIVALSATIPAAIFTTVGAISVLMLATKGLGDALKTAFDPKKAAQFEEAMKKLAPAARAFVMEIKNLAPAFRKLQQDVQQTFFVQLQGVLTRVSTKLLPVLRSGLHSLSADLGQMGASLLNAFGSSRTDIAAIFYSAHAALKPFIPAVGALTSALLTLGGAAGPLFASLSGSFAGMLVQFNEFIQRVAASGELTAFLEDMLTVLQQFGSILGSIVGLFMSIIEAAGAAGGDTLGVLASLVAMLDVFFSSAEGQEALIGIFTLLNTVLASVMAVMGPLLPVLGELIAELSGGLTDALKTITPLLEDAAKWLGEHPDVIKAAVAAWAIYKAALIAVAVWEAIVAALNPATWIILAIAAIAAGAYLIYKNWGALTRALTVAGKAIKDFFLGIWQWIVSVGRDIANWFTVTLPNFFASIPGIIGRALAALPQMLWNLFMGALHLAGEAIGIGVGLILVALIKLPGLIWEGIKSIGHLFVDLWNLAFAVGARVLADGIAAVIYIFTVLPGKIAGFVSRLPNIIGGAFRSAWDWAKREVRQGAEAVLDFVSKLPHRISGFFRNIGGSILSGLKSGINSVIGGFNSGINKVGGALHIGLPNIPYLAAGGLITSPTLAVVGEAGKEAVIPMSNPARAEQVARQTGLLAMIGSRQGHSEVPEIKVYLGTREITDILDVRIDKKLGDQANELMYGTR